MAKKKQSKKTKHITEITSIARSGHWMYMLFLDYEEGYGDEAPGQIYRLDLRGENPEQIEQVLNSNDAIRYIWTSPQGSLWASSQDGTMYTNAKVQWPKPTDEDLDFECLISHMKMTATTLPDLKDKGYSPSLGVIWGSSDQDVYVTAGEHIYHWNNKEWKQVHSAQGDINAFAGVKESVYAVGNKGVLLHFDGKKWNELKLPAGVDSKIHFTDCCLDSDGSILICSNDGVVIKGSAAKGFQILAQNDELQFSGIEVLDSQIILAAKSAGAFELKNGKFALMTKGKTYTIYEAIKGGDSLYFVGHDGNDDPGFIFFEPDNEEAPWSFLFF